LRKTEEIQWSLDRVAFNQVVLGSSPSGLTNEISDLIRIDQRPWPKSINGRARPL
jgi:hypothetical protein